MQTTTPIKVKVILGSTRPNRFSEIAGDWVADQLATRKDMDVELLDLREYPMPFFEEPISTSAKKEPFKNEAVARWTAKIADGDAYVVIAPEYNHAYPAVLKNALDYVYQEWNNKPVAFVAYGSAMGARVVEQLRLVAVELQMAPIRSAIHIPWDAVVAARENPAPAFAPFSERLSGLADQLAWWGQALRAARA